YEHVVPRKKDNRPQLNEDELLMTTVYWRHSNQKYSDFRRATTTLKNHQGQDIDLGLVEFYFLNEEHPVSPHKHKCTGKPFNPTSTSTKQTIKEAVKGKQGPSTIFSDIVNGVGGSLNCESVSDIPRNIDQVKQARAKLNFKPKHAEFVSLLDLAQSSIYIRNLQWTPVPRVVFSYDEVLEEIVNNCCKVNSSCVLSIDTTYGIGNKFVTTTTYPHAMLIDCVTGKHANLPGPAMFHVSEKKEDFVYFGQTLVQQNESIENVRFIGSDRSSALKGFMQPLKGAVLVPCTKHVKDNIERQFKTLGVNEKDKKSILFDIFGNTTLSRKGLIDSESVDDFDAKLEVLSTKWVRLDKGVDFLNYFQVNISDDMKVGMLPSVRREIGLNDNFFYSNAEECSHFKYKCKIREHKALTATGYGRNVNVSWLEAINVYKSMVDQVRENIRLAVLGIGPYSFAPEAQHLVVTQKEWSKLSPEDRRKHYAKIHFLEEM
ncbi:Hypothetical predicted protein, partial [Paramuricea clavata]